MIIPIIITIISIGMMDVSVSPIPPLELIHALALLPTAPILPLAMLLAPIPPPSLLHALLPALGILLVPTQPQTVLFALTLPLA